jgi:regulatory protein
VRQHLRRAGLDAEGIDSVLDQLRRHGLVDDQTFAEYWVDQRQTFRPRGARLMRAELTRLGVARSVADAATSELDGSAEEDAYRVAARRAARLQGLPPNVFAARLGAFLTRRGFDWEIIARVVERLSTSSDTARAPTG